MRMDWLASNWGLLVLVICAAILVAVFMRGKGKGEPTDRPPRD
jgi:hypothetical protein